MICWEKIDIPFANLPTSYVRDGKNPGPNNYPISVDMNSSRNEQINMDVPKTDFTSCVDFSCQIQFPQFNFTCLRRPKWLSSFTKNMYPGVRHKV